MMDKFDEGYKVRKEVLNMSIELWDNFDCLAEGGDSIITTPRAFLEKVGLAGGLSAKFNDQEREFFDSLYELRRNNT